MWPLTAATFEYSNIRVCWNLDRDLPGHHTGKGLLLNPMAKYLQHSCPKCGDYL